MIRIHKSLLLVWAIAPAMWACQSNQPPPAPTVPPLAHVKSFSASPTQLNPGDSTTLSWDVENATSVSIRTTDGQSVPLPDPSLHTGTVVVPVEQNSIFVLKATGQGGSDSAVASVVVTQKDTAPAVFSAYPPYIRAGEKTTLVWNAPAAMQVEIRDSTGQSVPTAGKNEGSEILTPGFTTTYTLSADGVDQSVTVTVAPALLAFQSDVPEASAGSTVHLSWQVGGAEQVILSSADRGVLTTVTDKAQLADGSYADTIPATLPNNGLMEYTLEARSGGTAIFSSLTVYVGANPVILSFNAPQFVKPGQDFPVSWQTALADRVDVLVDGQVFYRAPTRDLASNGTVVVPGITSATTVELRTSDLRGGSTSASAQVAPVDPPTFSSFTASPSTLVNGGDKLTLSWAVPNARHVKISRVGGRVLTELTGATLDTGSAVDYPGQQTVYQLEADNGAGDAIAPQQLTVNVTNPARLVFNPNNVPTSAPVQLTGATVAGDLYTMDQGFENQPGTQFIDISSSGQPLPVAVGDRHVWYPVVLPDMFQARWPSGYQAGGKKLYVSNVGNVVFSDSAPVGFVKLPPGTVSVAPADSHIDTQSQIYWQMDGTGTQRRLIVQWNNLGLEEGINGNNPQWVVGHVTMQVQFYATGEVVMAFGKGFDIETNPYPGQSTSVNVPGFGTASVVRGAWTTNGLMPAPGDTLRFFGKFPLPYTVTASTTKMNVEVALLSGARIALQDGPAIVAPGAFNISEVNYNPVTGQQPWIELQNNTAQPVNLTGWYLDLGSGTRNTLSSSAIIPANGRLLLAPTSTSIEGAQVNYAYGTGFVLPTTSGTLKLNYAEATTAYDSITWSSAGTAGVSLQRQMQSGTILTNFATSFICPSSRSYGTNGQKGTPGQANSPCLKWTMAPLATGSFQSIASTGTPVSNGTTTLVSTADNSISTGIVALNFTTSGGRAVKIGGTTCGNSTAPIYVDPNGFAGLNGPSTNDFNPSTPNSTSATTSTLGNLLATFWEDLAGNDPTKGPSGVYWQQFNPDGIVGNSDDYTLISWENMRYKDTNSPQLSSSSLNFQIKIFEATGDVEYQYGSMTSSNGIYSDGTRSTVWISANENNAALPISVKTANIIKSNSGYHYTYTP